MQLERQTPFLFVFFIFVCVCHVAQIEGYSVEEHFPLDDKFFVNDYTRNMLFCFLGETGLFVQEFSDPSLRDSIYGERHVDAPIGMTWVPSEKKGKENRELVIINENELLQYAFFIDKNKGPSFKLRNHYVLPSWGFAAVVQRRVVPPDETAHGERPLPSPFSWKDEELDEEGVHEGDYSVLVSIPEKGYIIKYSPETKSHAIFSERYKPQTFIGRDGEKKNDFVPTDMRLGPDGALYVGSRAKNAVLKLGGMTGHLMEVFTKQEVPSPVGITFLYRKSCKIPEHLPAFVLFDLLVASYTDNCVYRFDGKTGEFKGQFVKPGAGGLDGPLGIGISPFDHQLYVASSNTGAILKYDSTTGEFLSEFIPPRDRLVKPSYFTWGIDARPPPAEPCDYSEIIPPRRRAFPPPPPPPTISTNEQQQEEEQRLPLQRYVA